MTPTMFSPVKELEGNVGGVGGGGASGGVGKRWLHSLDHHRRLKDEDPIIPFSEAPIISKWGAISRASRTGFHTTDPVQATACQGSASTTPINFKGKSWVRGLVSVEEDRKRDKTRLVSFSYHLLSYELSWLAVIILASASFLLYSLEVHLV